MITKKAKYALKALLYLTDRWGQSPTLIAEIAREETIPKKFLELILLELKEAGVVGSKKGKGGGYFLVEDPKKLNFIRILRLVDGPIAPLPCVSLNFYKRCEDCQTEQECRLHAMLVEVRDANIAVLEKLTLKPAEGTV